MYSSPAARVSSISILCRKKIYKVLCSFHKYAFQLILLSENMRGKNINKNAYQHCVALNLIMWFNWRDQKWDEEDEEMKSEVKTWRISKMYQAKSAVISFSMGGGPKIKVAQNGLKYISFLDFFEIRWNFRNRKKICKWSQPNNTHPNCTNAQTDTTVTRWVAPLFETARVKNACHNYIIFIWKICGFLDARQQFDCYRSLQKLMGYSNGKGTVPGQARETGPA